MPSDSEPEDEGLDEDEAEEYEQDLEDEPDAAADEATEDGEDVRFHPINLDYYLNCSSGVCLGRL